MKNRQSDNPTAYTYVFWMSAAGQCGHTDAGVSRVNTQKFI